MSDKKNNEFDHGLPAMEDLLAELKPAAAAPAAAAPATMPTDAPTAAPVAAPAAPEVVPVVEANGADIANAADAGDSIVPSPIPIPERSSVAPAPIAASPPTINPQANEQIAHQGQNSLNEPVNMRTQQDFNKAQRHSQFVKRTKILLPLIVGLIVFGFIAVGFFYRQLPDNISVNSAAISNGNLVMESPNLDGFDKNNLPYSVRADRAIQNLENTDVIDLEGIHARLPIDDKNFVKVDANNGVFNNKEQTLKLLNKIVLISDNGFKVNLENASIDIRSGHLISNAPVMVEAPDGVILADSLEISENGKKIMFKDNVKMTLNPQN